MTFPARRFHSEFVFWACLLAGALACGVAALTFVASRTLFDSAVFGERAAESLSDPGVARYAAELVTQSVVSSRPDLIAVRPLITAAATTLVSARPARALIGTAAKRAHEAAFSEGGRNVVVSIPDLRILLENAVRHTSPELAARIPPQVQTVVGQLGDNRYERVLLAAWHTGTNLRWSWRLLFPVSLALLAAALWAAPNRRRGAVRIGIALMVTGLILTGVVPAAGLAGRLIWTSSLEQGLVAGLAHAYLRDVTAWGILYAGVGVLLAAGAASLLEFVDPLVQCRRVGLALLEPPATRRRRAAWGGALLATGVFAVVFPRAFFDALVVIAGVTIAYVGVRELFRVFHETLAAKHTEVHPHPDEDDSEWHWAWPAAAVATVAGALVLGWLLWRAPPARPSTSPAVLACNGHQELCDRPVDELAFAATHNSMSSQDVPGWMFPHHEAGIARQLEDGVRALLLDVHAGFPSDTRVKTDLDNDPTAARAKSVIGPAAYEAALRIRNRLVAVQEDQPRLYLCHGLCELGAYDFETALREIRAFLITHPDEVLLLILEDYVQPGAIEAAFQRSGLSDYVFKGMPQGKWPTPRQMIQSGERVIVFLESGRGGVPWLLPAFRYIRETPFLFQAPGEFSCRANRGGDEGSLFLLNHWIDTTPAPRPSNAAVVNAARTLLERARRCAEERKHPPNIVAVDFYRTGDVLRVVNELNGIAR